MIGNHSTSTVPAAVGGKTSSRRPRRGITIIEMMVVMTGVAGVLALCAITIQLLMRLNSDGHARVTSAAAIERLSQQIRQDAHASDAALLDQKAGDKRAALRLKNAPDHDVLYEPMPGQIVRVESKDAKAIRRETYALPPQCTARFELRDEGSRRLVALIVTHDSVRNPTEPPRPLEVVAVQGKDRVGPLGKPGGKTP